MNIILTSEARGRERAIVSSVSGVSAIRSKVVAGGGGRAAVESAVNSMLSGDFRKEGSLFLVKA
jgi:hypothetical protein